MKHCFVTIQMQSQLHLEVQKLEKRIITDKVEKLDVKGQGCSNDCASAMWVGNRSYKNGCVYVTGTPTSQTTSWW